MPFYLITDDREKLKQIQRTNRCADCGGELETLYDVIKHLPFAQCKAHPEHEGIAKINKKSPEFNDYNINTRREIMAEQTGEKGTAVAIPTSGKLTQPQAMQILQLVYPDVPESEIIRCAILCRDFGLHPLMKEVFIIPFGTGDKRTWSTVLGINATRKMMSLRGSYSYMDNTPRIMTEDEQMLIFGEIDKQNIVALTRLKTRSGEEAPGYGRWPRDKAPYGMDHGNTKANMAFIRSERNAFGRLFPDSIPPEVEIIDETYADLPKLRQKVDTETGEIAEGEFTEVTPPAEAKQQVGELTPEVKEKLIKEKLQEIVEKAEEAGWGNAGVREFIVKKKWEAKTTIDLTVDQLDEILEAIKQTHQKPEDQKDLPF